MATKMSRQRAMDEGRQPAANPEDDVAPGGTPPSRAVDRATAVAVGSPTQGRTPPVADVEPDTPPEYVDRHFLEAYSRYVSLLSNGVTHHRALAAVKVADPNFDLDEQAAVAILKALNKNDEPIKLAEELYTFASQPPGHVTRAYDALEMTDDDMVALGESLFQLHQDAWIAAMNENLSRLGKPNITRIENQDVLNELRREADKAAQQIGDTFNRDMAAQLYAAYIEHHAVLGRQSSETILREVMEEWAEERSEWKADQVATYQTNLIFNLAMREFRAHNPKLNAEYGRVVPLGGQCDACQDASMLGLQPAEIILELGMPLHVGCVHSVEWQFGDDESEGNIWTGELP